MKSIFDQVVVVTGASSGIGRATVELTAERGARVVLAARSEQTLHDIARRIDASGERTLVVPCDVADQTQVREVADATIERFGRIDTWVNNAGLGLYGHLDENNPEDARRLFDVNFWGVVYGSLTALPHLRRSGGALINVGSEVSEAAMPVLGMYVASKHAVKGFTDCLRIEQEILDNADVAVTLIQPTAVDTPFPHHARNFMDREPSLPTPLIEPRKVAEAILDAAVRHTRDKKVGTKAFINTAIAKFSPRMGDKLAAKEAAKLRADERPQHPEGVLRQSCEQMAGASHEAS